MIQHNILVTGDDSRTLHEASRILKRGGYEATVASGGDGVEALLNRGDIPLVLVDFTPGDTTLPSALQTIRSASPETMIVLQGGPMDGTSMKTLFNSDADDCICKPYQPEELLFRVGKNIEVYKLKRKARLRKGFFSNCCICKKIRVDDYGSAKDRWREVEDFLKEEMDILLSSTYCPKCAQTVQEDLLVQLDRLKA